MEEQRRYEKSRQGRRRYEVSGFMTENWQLGKVYCAATMDFVLSLCLPPYFQIDEREWKTLVAEADKSSV